jgi:hypothetical protein
MSERHLWPMGRVSAEISVSADLGEVCRWLIECQDSVRFDAGDLPAFGQASWLRLALPITASRAVLCAVRLIGEGDSGGCLLEGHLRFVAHPSSSDLKLSFNGRAMPTPARKGLRGENDGAADQVLGQIAIAIEQRRARTRVEIAS